MHLDCTFSIHLPREATFYIMIETHQTNMCLTNNLLFNNLPKQKGQFYFSKMFNFVLKCTDLPSNFRQASFTKTSFDHVMIQFHNRIAQQTLHVMETAIQK